MFKKNKKIFKFLIGSIILSLPATLKVSAMEKNQNLKTTVETTQEKYNFSSDKEFNSILEDHLKHLFSTILVEDLKKYTLNSIDCNKKLSKINDFSDMDMDMETEIAFAEKKIFDELYEKFKKYNENFIEKIIKSNKNSKVNFYYYKYLINRIYRCGFVYIESNIEDYFKFNKNYHKILDAITKYGELLFDGVSKTIKEAINIKNVLDNRKYFNIPKQYKTFKEYLKENPKIAIEDEKDDMHKAIIDICFICMDNVIGENLEKIFKKAGIKTYKKARIEDSGIEDSGIED